MTLSSTMDLNLIDCRRYTEDGKIIVKLSKKSKRKIASTTPELRQSTTTRKFYAFYRAYVFLSCSIQRTTKYVNKRRFLLISVLIAEPFMFE